MDPQKKSYLETVYGGGYGLPVNFPGVVDDFGGELSDLKRLADTSTDWDFIIQNGLANPAALAPITTYEPYVESTTPYIQMLMNSGDWYQQSVAQQLLKGKYSVRSVLDGIAEDNEDKEADDFDEQELSDIAGLVKTFNDFKLDEELKKAAGQLVELQPGQWFTAETKEHPMVERAREAGFLASPEDTYSPYDFFEPGREAEDAQAMAKAGGYRSGAPGANANLAELDRRIADQFKLNRTYQDIINPVSPDSEGGNLVGDLVGGLQDSFKTYNDLGERLRSQTPVVGDLVGWLRDSPLVGGLRDSFKTYNDLGGRLRSGLWDFVTGKEEETTADQLKNVTPEQQQEALNRAVRAGGVWTPETGLSKKQWENMYSGIFGDPDSDQGFSMRDFKRTAPKPGDPGWTNTTQGMMAPQVRGVFHVPKELEEQRDRAARQAWLERIDNRIRQYDLKNAQQYVDRDVTGRGITPFNTEARERSMRIVPGLG